MDECVVSFCIASYKRANIVIELLDELLRLNSNKFEIIICDDCSNDGTVEKLRKINDERLKIFVNEKNVGGMMNIYCALSHGKGKYLFYLNDRDQVDAFKVSSLIETLGYLSEENVVFARCLPTYDLKKYEIYDVGESSFCEFACNITHPSGYIFDRNVFSSVDNAKMYFEERFGDYGFSIICAILSLKYKGAYIYGNMCDIKRRRIDFSMEKSRFYANKKDKHMFYSIDVQVRELEIAYKISKELKVCDEWMEKLLIRRYREYYNWLVVAYRDMMRDPVNTTHYNIAMIDNETVLYRKAIRNGREMKYKTKKMLKKMGISRLNPQIDKISYEVMKNFIEG